MTRGYRHGVRLQKNILNMSSPQLRSHMSSNFKSFQAMNRLLLPPVQAILETGPCPNLTAQGLNCIESEGHKGSA
jgi:hypothetical protein